MKLLMQSLTILTFTYLCRSVRFVNFFNLSYYVLKLFFLALRESHAIFILCNWALLWGLHKGTIEIPELKQLAIFHPLWALAAEKVFLRPCGMLGLWDARPGRMSSLHHASELVPVTCVQAPDRAFRKLSSSVLYLAENNVKWSTLTCVNLMGLIH